MQIQQKTHNIVPMSFQRSSFYAHRLKGVSKDCTVVVSCYTKPKPT